MHKESLYKLADKLYGILQVTYVQSITIFLFRVSKKGKVKQRKAGDWNKRGREKRVDRC